MCLDLVLVRKQSFLFQFSLFQSYEHSWIITCLHPSSSVAVAYPNVKTCQCVSPSVISLLSVYCACPNFSRREREERGGGGGGGGSQIKIDLIFLRRRVGLSAVTYFVGCHVLPWRVTLCFSQSRCTACRDESFLLRGKRNQKFAHA